MRGDLSDGSKETRCVSMIVYPAGQQFPFPARRGISDRSQCLEVCIVFGEIAATSKSVAFSLIFRRKTW